MKRTILVTVLVITLLISACGGNAPAPAPAENPTEKPAEKPAEKVTLRLWSHQNAAFQQGNEAIIAKFKAQNPNIDIQYENFPYDDYIQTIQTAMAAKNEADVIELFGTWTCSYAKAGRLMEVPADVMTYEQAQQTYFKAPLDGYYCDGKLYGLPHEFNLENGGALVNPALFEKHGVTYPPQWKTFADMIADAQKMTEVEGGQMLTAGFSPVTGDGLSFTFLAGILQQGGKYFAEDGKHFNFDTPEARKTIQMLVDLAQKDKVVDPVLFNDTTNPVSTSFFTGNIAIGFVGSWAAGEGKIEFPDMKFDYVQIPPYFGTEQKFAADSGWGKVVSVNTKHPAEAWKLVKFMAAEQDGALTWNIETKTIPAMKALVDNPEKLLAAAPFIKATFSLLPFGQYIGDVTERDQLFYEIIYPAVLEAMQGATTVDDAAIKINTEANAMVDAKQ